MRYQRIQPWEIVDREGLVDWRAILRTIRAEFDAGTFAAAGELAAAIARLADESDHHPELDLRYPALVRVRLTTGAVDDLTTADVELARAISELALRAGATAHPLASQEVELAIDTLDADRIRPFWAAVLGYRPNSDGSLVDPVADGPSLWFQQMDEPRLQRNRIHYDIVVPHDVADDRIAAALEAGGTMVDDRRARAFWVLADAEGNEACICTWQDRDATTVSPQAT